MSRAELDRAGSGRRSGETRMHWIIGLAALAALSTATPAWAQAERKCDISAYTIDEDPKGINIRATPSNQGKVVGVIRTGKDADIGVSIAAESNGWFRLRSYETYATGKTTRVNGWVHGTRLGSGLMIMQGGKASERLREEPSDQSKTLLLLTWDPGENAELQRLTAELPMGKSEVIDFAKIKNAATAVPLACQNGWVKIRVHKYEGWVPQGRLCGNPVTTCN